MDYYKLDLMNRLYFEDHKEVISGFLYSYFEVSSLLEYKFGIKDVSSKNFLSKIKSTLNCDDILVIKVFGSINNAKQNISNPCKKLRNAIVHKLDKLKEMQYIVDNYDEIKEQINDMKTILLTTEARKKIQSKTINKDKSK